MLDRPRPPAVLDILEEHQNELGSLWAQRERLLFSADWTVKDLANLEDRAEAHLDGLRLGATNSVDFARPALIADEAGPATAATFVLMAFGIPELEREVLDAFKAAPPKGRNGIRIGLRHCDIVRIAPQLSEMAVSAEPAVRAAALDVLAFHRHPPPKGIPMLLGDPDPEVRRLVYEAAGRFGGPWSYDIIREALDGDSPALRIAALRASARMGLLGLDDTCRQAATRAQNPVPEALEFLGIVGSPKDLGLLQNSIMRPELADAALSAIGKLGSVVAIPALLDLMANEKLALAACRAFVRITGATEVLADPPDPAKARAWWEKEKAPFKPEGRFQSGHDIAKTPLGEHFDKLPLETRLDLYLGERARDPQRTQDRELETRVSEISRPA